MDAKTLELLRALQGTERDAAALESIRAQYRDQRRALAGADDRATLSDLSEMLEVWAEQAPRPEAALALFEAALSADEDLQQPERAIELLAASLGRSAGDGDAFDALLGVLRRQNALERLAGICERCVRGLLEAEDLAGAALVHRCLGRALASAEPADVPSAIAAYERALDFEADVESIEELAMLYERRGHESDAAQAADLYATLGDALGTPEGVRWLERALDLVPSHDAALDTLEALTPLDEHLAKLRERWAAYLEASGSGDKADARRLELSRSYASEGRYRDALVFISPLAERGHTEASVLREAYLANLEGVIGPKRGKAAQGSVPAPRHVRPARSGETIVGFKLDEYRASLVAKGELNPREAQAQQQAEEASAQPQAAQDDAASAAAQAAEAPAAQPASEPAPRGASDPGSDAISQIVTRAEASALVGAGAQPHAEESSSASSASTATDAEHEPGANGASLVERHASASALRERLSASSGRRSLPPPDPDVARRPSSIPPSTAALPTPVPAATAVHAAAMPSAITTAVGTPAPVTPAAFTPAAITPDAASTAAAASSSSLDDELAAKPATKAPLLIGAAVVAIGLLGVWLFAGGTSEPPSAAPPSRVSQVVAAPVAAPAAAAPTGVAATAAEPAAAEPAATAPGAPDAPATADANELAKKGAAADTPEAADTPAEAEAQAAAAGKPTVSLVMAGVQIRGGNVGPRQLASALEDELTRIERCYAQALADEPALAGRITVSFTVMKTGKSALARIDKSTLEHKAVERCTLEALRGGRFPHGKRPANVTVPLDFAH